VVLDWLIVFKFLRSPVLQKYWPWMFYHCWQPCSYTCVYILQWKCPSQIIEPTARSTLWCR